MEQDVKRQRVYTAIAAISALGFFVSLYATYLHFSAGPSTLCNINATFNCDVVNKGIYSEVFGIPISVLGMIGYVWFFILAYEMLRRPNRRIRLMFAASIAFAAGFSLHLAWISSALLATWCIVCIASYICTLAILGLFSWSEI